MTTECCTVLQCVQRSILRFDTALSQSLSLCPRAVFGLTTIVSTYEYECQS
jgi:hypothetical protein